MDINITDIILLQETTALLMWTSVSLLHVSMEEAARTSSTLISVSVQMALQVGDTSYQLFNFTP